MALKIRSVSLNLPFGLGGMDIDVTEAEARAAWELYVEFSTRVAAHPLAPGAGSVREALDSVYTLFGTTREVLRDAGPEAGHGPDSLGPLAIRVLNEGLRPFQVKWHAESRAAEANGAELARTAARSSTASSRPCASSSSSTSASSGASPASTRPDA